MDIRVKICGVTNVGDALFAIDAGADAIGLNFYRGSARCVIVDEARRITDAVSQIARCVGVFVNAPAAAIHETAAKVALHYVQLHGDEPPAFLKQLNCNRGIIRARRLDETGMTAIRDDLLECRAVAGLVPQALLIDAAVPGMYGGSGRIADWQAVTGYREWIGDVPLILAGGLTPANVATAIATVRPQAVDVAGGVESSPGKKDPGKVRDFVAAARAAFS